MIPLSNTQANCAGKTSIFTRALKIWLKLMLARHKLVLISTYDKMDARLTELYPELRNEK